MRDDEGLVIAAVPSSGGWTQERIDLVKRTIVPQGIPDGPFALFIEQCQRLGMDPLLKEVFCIERRVNIAPKGQPPKYVVKYETQVAEAGMLRRADQFPDFLGIQGAAVFEKDDPAVADPVAGVVQHRIHMAKERGKLVGAWALAERKGMKPVVIFLYLDDYRQPTPNWDNKAPTMILKCARVAALRVLFPQVFAGVYIPEEMEGKDNSDVQTLTPEKFVAAPMPALEENERIADWDGDQEAAYQERQEAFVEEPVVDLEVARLSRDEELAMEIEAELADAKTTDHLKAARVRIGKLPNGDLRKHLAGLYNEKSKTIGGKP